jgi:hypothetical protein
MSYMFWGVYLPAETYDALLEGWAARAKEEGVQDSVNFHGGESQCSSEKAKEGRQYLIDEYNWDITDNVSISIIHEDETGHTGPLLRPSAKGIGIAGNIPHNTVLNLYSPSGRMVFSAPVGEAGSIPLPALSPGVYSAQLQAKGRGIAATLIRIE